jgi:hypothetical protein
MSFKNTFSYGNLCYNSSAMVTAIDYLTRAPILSACRKTGEGKAKGRGS